MWLVSWLTVIAVVTCGTAAKSAWWLLVLGPMLGSIATWWRRLPPLMRPVTTITSPMRSTTWM